jgi:hypothetical protein
MEDTQTRRHGRCGVVRKTITATRNDRCRREGRAARRAVRGCGGGVPPVITWGERSSQTSEIAMRKRLFRKKNDS